MKKTIFLVALCFCCLESGIGQKTQSPKVSTVNVYGDFGLGPLSSGTINMEVRLTSSNSGKVQLYARGGYGSIIQFGIFCDGNNSKGGIMGLTMLVGKGNHKFEISGGGYLGSWIEDSTSCKGEQGSHRIPIAELGYRYQNLKNQFLFRAKLGVLGGGIGIGFCF